MKKTSTKPKKKKQPRKVIALSLKVAIVEALDQRVFIAGYRSRSELVERMLEQHLGNE